ncbi:MAG: dihydroorotate dehydrogenase, partial [Deltaproteobacteria bacterium]|nr:dihydroorotate dehydrogenase [Deltaproteobacteria bacterium]
ASAIQVGTANFVDPGVSLKIIEGLKKFCEDQGISSIEEIIGSLKVE